MKYIIILLAAVLMFGCGGKDRVKPSVDTVNINKQITTISITPPTDPDSIVWKEFEWTVLTPKIMKDLLDKYNAGEINEKDMVFYGITPKGYENLSINMSEVMRYIKQQKAVIMYYKDTVPSVIGILPED